MNNAPIGKRTLDAVRAAQLRYLDQVCEAWPRSSERAAPAADEPPVRSSDIYAGPSEAKRPETFQRRRHDWPY